MTAPLSRRGVTGPMVHLRTVPNAFHARVIAARLGADGILTELRGNVGGPYPIGHVSVWVNPEDEEVASELLLADEVEDSFSFMDEPNADTDTDADADTLAPVAHPALLFGWELRRVLAAAALILMILGTVAGRLLT